MLVSSIPVKIPTPFASGAGGSYIRSVPIPSQIGITAGAASFTDGFPPVTFQAGGAPAGTDVNGLFNQITAWNRWHQAGGPIYYDATFSAAIGGYPNGATLRQVSNPSVYWVSTVDNNTTNPDTGGAGWVSAPLLQPIATATFYVNASTGNDANPGTAALPFATVQGAVNAISATYFSSSAVTVNIAAGTYTGLVINPSLVFSWNFVGAGVASVNFSYSSAAQGRSLLVGSGVRAIISGVTFSSSVYENVNLQPSSVVTVTNCNFTCPSTSSAFIIGNYGGYLNLVGTCAVASGSCAGFIFAGAPGAQVLCGYHDSYTSFSITVNFGTMTFSSGTVVTSAVGVVAFAPGYATFAGTITGPRFNCTTAGGINTQGSGINYLPGSVAGTATSPGWYV